MSDDKFWDTSITIVSLAIVVVLVLAFLGLVLLVVSGCDSPPPQERTTPFAVWCFEDAKGLADSTGFDYLLPDAYYEPGEVYHTNDRWRAYQFIVPKPNMIAVYKFQWAPPNSVYKTLCIAVVDTTHSGILWIAARDVLDGDRVKLVEP